MVPHPGTPVRTHRLRPLNTPRRVIVELNGRDLPVVVFAPADDGQTRTVHRREIETVGEIWHVDDEWWRQRICRRYIEVVMKGGKHTVLYEDLVTHEWFEQTP